MKDNKGEQLDNQEIVLYQSGDGEVSFNVNVFDESVWLTQKQMAELFDRDYKTISKHINNIFRRKELNKNSVVAKFAITASDGKDYNVEHYNLDMIISVGYRVNSQRGILFRQWATKILKQYMLNGYAVNETRIRQIESSVNELVASNKLLKEDVDGIKNLLLKLIERPIVINHNHNHIHNNLSLISNDLESKLIELLDKIISQLETDSAKSSLQNIKQDIAANPKNDKSKNRIINFFNDLGDNNSKLHKSIKGAGIAKELITELIKLGEKLKNIF